MTKYKQVPVKLVSNTTPHCSYDFNGNQWNIISGTKLPWIRQGRFCHSTVASKSYQRKSNRRSRWVSFRSANLWRISVYIWRCLIIHPRSLNANRILVLKYDSSKDVILTSSGYQTCLTCCTGDSLLNIYPRQRDSSGEGWLSVIVDIRRILTRRKTKDRDAQQDMQANVSVSLWAESVSRLTTQLNKA